MTELPTLTESVLRQRATDQSWRRGLDYFHSGAVLRVVWRDGMLTAEVEGSQYEPYRVQVSFDPSGGILSATCSCPYDWGGDCKHIIATLLYLVYRRQEIEQRPSLTQLLSGLSREQLVELVQILAEIHPEVIEDVEDFVQASSAPTVAPPVPLPVDLDALQRQIRAQLRSRASDLYESYYEYEGDWDLGDVLEPALEQVWQLLEGGNPRGALAVLEAATVAWIEGCRRLDQDFLSDLEGMEDDTLTEWGKAWAEALLMADLTPEERARWGKLLKGWQQTMFGGTVLDIAITAAEHGWDYPPLVAAMQGHITEKGAWEDEPPDFADDLAEIRLRILERQGRYEEYLNLAEAEGQFMRFLQMLIRVGRAEQAFTEARQYLTEPQDILTIVRALAEHGEDERALALAAHGLTQESPRGRAVLAEWLRDEALARGQLDLALQAAWQTLKDAPALENYRWLEKHAASQWPTLRAQALAIVETAASRNPNAVLEIYLYEKMHRQAMELADRMPGRVDLKKVIAAVQREFPDWAFQKCRRPAEEIMDLGRASDYDVAVEWLRLGRNILLAAGKKAEWDAYLRSLLEKHQRKYKLVPMLKRLEV